MAKNKEKLSTSQLIMIHHEKNVDPFFLYQMGLIKLKPFHCTVPLKVLSKVREGVMSCISR
jgi:hypothetical protein